MDYSPGKPGRPFVAGAQATHGAAEYGEDQRAIWQRLVEPRAVA
jgi:hypothetical protein